MHTYSWIAMIATGYFNNIEMSAHLKLVANIIFTYVAPTKQPPYMTGS